MLHLANSWPQYADPTYWPQAINYATWVFNILPNMDSGISLNELWSTVRSSDDIFKQANVFGCPVYVLYAALQDGKKIPKWSPHAHLGLFLGFSEVHSSQVPLILNVETKKISPQFHVIFDDNFHTVNLLQRNTNINEQWKDILRLERECFAEMDYDEHGEPKLPLLSDIIKTFREEREQWPRQEPITPNFDVPHDDHVEDQAVIQVQDPAPLLPTQEECQDIPVQGETIIPIQAQENPLILPGGDNNVVDNGRPRQNVGTYKDQQKFGGYQLMANPMNSHNSSTSLSMLFTLFQRF
jgi:hypothetical protein